MREFFRFAIGVSLLGACSDNAHTIPVTTNALGVQGLIVDQPITDGGNRQVTIHGLDGAGAELATATFDIGQIEFRYEADATPDVVDGIALELRWNASGVHGNYAIPTNFPREIGKPLDANLHEFVELDEVATQIAQISGFRFTVAPPSLGGHRQGFDAGNCDSSDFPSGMAACWQDYCSDYSCRATVSKTATLGHLIFRQYSAPCTNYDGSYGCGQGTGTACFYGPCGGNTYGDYTCTGAGCLCYYYDSISGGWTTDYSSGTGWPSAWSGQGEYPGVGAGCGYSVCHSDGSRS